MGKITFEIAVENIDSVKEIQESRVADRIELCDNLMVGGTTPSAGLIQQSLKSSYLPVMVLIRPRPGDFHYSKSEFDVMISDVMFVKIAGVSGVVTGILKVDGHVDRERMAR
ncbi:MAG TPA: copper homeostasis protein CutC, partial [Balneolales bacterium]|nr:copper homeostasis protein CutC [Balneolales bacterium]